jgi:hypothetical protein
MESATSGIAAFAMGPGLASQLFIVIITMLALQVVMTMLEKINQFLTKLDRQAVVLFDNTAATHVEIPQGPNTGFPILYNSRDEQQGSAFSYSMFIFIHPDTFETAPGADDKCSSGRGNQAYGFSQVKLKHIFHKGSDSGFPNLAPAIFVQSDVNTIRIYMNTIDSWNNYVSVTNVPVGKWFHLVVMLKGNNLDVYINGNISVRMKLATVPKLNTGPIFVMKNMYFPDKTGYDQTLFGDYTVTGPMKGMVSRLKYFSYALNYAHIDALYRERANTSSILKQSIGELDPNGQQPPYFWDDWWVNKY